MILQHCHLPLQYQWGLVGSCAITDNVQRGEERETDNKSIPVFIFLFPRFVFVFFSPHPSLLVSRLPPPPPFLPPAAVPAPSARSEGGRPPDARAWRRPRNESANDLEAAAKEPRRRWGETRHFLLPFPRSSPSSPCPNYIAWSASRIKSINQEKNTGHFFWLLLGLSSSVPLIASPGQGMMRRNILLKSKP